MTLPDPRPGPGEVLIRVEAAAVNYSDIARRSGALYPFPTPLPFVLGGEVAGTVAELGTGVQGPPVGTPVFALVGSDGSGGYAELAVAGAQQVVPTPAGLAPDQAAGITIAGTTATALLTQTAPVAGKSLLVPAAAGGVGSFALQIAKLADASTIIAAASSPDKRAAALALGADHAVDLADPAWVEQVRGFTAGAGVDVALEATGGDTLDQTLRALAPLGIAVIYGMASGQRGRISDDTLDRLFYRPSLGQTLTVFNLGVYFGLRPQLAGAALGQLIDWVTTGKVNIPVGHTFALADAADAHRLMETRGSTGKIVLKP